MEGSEQFRFPAGSRPRLNFASHNQIAVGYCLLRTGWTSACQRPAASHDRSIAPPPGRAAQLRCRRGGVVRSSRIRVSSCGTRIAPRATSSSEARSVQPGAGHRGAPQSGRCCVAPARAPLRCRGRRWFHGARPRLSCFGRPAPPWSSAPAGDACRGNRPSWAAGLPCPSAGSGAGPRSCSVGPMQWWLLRAEARSTLSGRRSK